jgi:LPXTG-motif cell wall-anchored protein
VARTANDSLPPETFQPADASARDDGGGLPKPLLAGAPVALLLGLGIVGWRRRR